jgi:alcohol dehydrogenase class IV
MRFEFASATRIIFGPGTVLEAASISAEMGKRAFIITGSTIERAEPLLERLGKEGIDYVTFNVSGEPTTIVVVEAVQAARKAKCDLVISIGGGSVLDTGKAVAAMLTNSGQLQDYLEVVGAGRKLKLNAATHIAIPTTAGTGAEVTRNAVLSVPEHRVKVSMRSPYLLPQLAVVDPELTHSMPPAVTASTGLDALTQLLEVYVSGLANPLTDGICREGLMRAGRSLRRVYEDGNDQDAREDMALASLFSGLGLANAKLGAVHGYAGPLGGMYSAPHGVICARLLPFVMEANVQALRQRDSASSALLKYDEVAQVLTGDSSAKANDAVTWVQELCLALKVPSMSQFGLRQEDFETIVTKAKKSSSMKGNPVKLTNEELFNIIRQASTDML